jgi:hypothetical protein
VSTRFIDGKLDAARLLQQIREVTRDPRGTGIPGD